MELRSNEPTFDLSADGLPALRERCDFVIPLKQPQIGVPILLHGYRARNRGLVLRRCHFRLRRR